MKTQGTKAFMFGLEAKSKDGPMPIYPVFSNHWLSHAVFKDRLSPSSLVPTWKH
jgi:hypothetical protein